MENKIDLEREFTDAQVSEWILYKTFNDLGILDAFSVVNDSKWYADERVATLMDLIIRSYRKHKVKPTKESVIGNIRYIKSVNKTSLDENELINYFNRIVSTPIDIDTETVNDAIELFVKNSGLYQVFDKLANSKLGISNKKVTISSTLKNVHKFEEFTLDNNIGLDFFSKEGQDRLWKFLTSPEAKLPTGIPWIDKVTNGGIYRDGHFLGVITAAPNVGKSVILANLAYGFLKQNLTVLIISLEMSECVYGRRITSLVADSCIDTLGNNENIGRENTRAFFETCPNAKLLIKEFPSGGASANNIRSYVEHLLRQDIKPDVILLDYINLLKPSEANNHGDKRHEQVGYITKEVRAVSTELGIPIFSATQSNREGYNNTQVKMSNISQSTAVAEDADFILSAYAFDEDAIDNKIRMEVIKSRLGGKNYGAHLFQIAPDTLALIDKGDAAIELNNGMVDLSEVINNSKKKKKPKVEDVPEYGKAIVDAPSNITQNVSDAVQDLEDDTLFD